MITPYNQRFYESHVDGSWKSAERVLPHVLNLICPGSVVDIGCGSGAWAAVAAELGVSDITGVDGDYVDRDHLLIPRSSYVAADLTAPLNIDRTYDLSISMEVAEHLAPEFAEHFVSMICSLAPASLFSAAIPNQGGTDHKNEQWPKYWAERFAVHHFDCFDVIRMKVWNDENIDVWYRQNSLLFVQRGTDVHKTISELNVPVDASDVPALVHPELFGSRCDSARFQVGDLAGPRALLTAFPKAFRRASKRRMSKN